MNPAQTTLLKHIEFIAGFHSKYETHNKNNMYTRLLKEGRFFESYAHRPSEYPLKPLRNCFQNAYQMLGYDSNLEYAEGICFSGLIPVHHAFNVDSQGKVIDTTWRTRGKWGVHSEKREYFGIVIPQNELNEVLLKTRTYGYWKF